MKKLLCILICIVGFIYSVERIEIIGDGCAIKDSEIWRTSKRIAVAAPGLEFPVLRVHGDWYYVSILKGTWYNEYRDGKYVKCVAPETLVGYIWVGGFDREKLMVLAPGVHLRSSPEKKADNIIGALFGDTEIKILECVVTWYHVQNNGWAEGDWKTGWVGAKRARVIK